ncbi:MAG: PAS domain-containing protein, partial [Alphaproteobacteria bacterium]|nr:PAS domain-containing protein [Alphaproteobacteria bacterium]
MSKNKVKKLFSRLMRFLMQAAVINAPIAVILLLVHFLEGMSWTTMAIALILASFLTVPLVLFVLDVLEVLTRSVHADDQVLGSSKLTNIWLSIRNLHEAPSLPDVRILESLPDPLLMINERSNIVFVNQSAREFFDGALLHQSLSEAFPDASFAESVRTKELFEWTCQPEGERPYTFQVRVERLPARARRGAVAVIVFNDVTPFKLFKQQQA